MRTTLKIEYETQDEKARKLTAILAAMGYRVEKETVEPVTVGELAASVGRSVGSVSRSLKRYGLHRIRAEYGNGAERKRIKKLWPDERLRDFLACARFVDWVEEPR